MINIRDEQLRVLAQEEGATDGELALAIRDIGWFDEMSEAHRQLVAAGRDEPCIDALRRFVGAKRAEAAAFGIRHEYLVLYYTGFFFRYGADWQQRDDVAPVLADRALGEEAKMQAIQNALRLAALRG